MIKVNDIGKIKEIIIENNILSCEILNFGATLKSIKYQGKELLLSYKDTNNYLTDTNYLGKTIGRYANRISGGEFNLNNNTYYLTQNENGNHLHGGIKAYDKQIWDYEIIDDYTLKMYLFSIDGDNGYPGNIDNYIIISLKNNILMIEYNAISDKDTIYGPTNHAYFNLGNDNILDLLLQINADHYIHTDNNNLPITINKCQDIFDFKKMKKINDDFDHCFILNNIDACILQNEKWQLKIKTNYPGLQLYTGKYLSDDLGINTGLALEPEFFPDSPNHADYPSPLLKKNDKFYKYIQYTFNKLV